MNSLYGCSSLIQRMCETERVKSGPLHVVFLFGAFPLALFILLSQAAQSCTQDRLHASSNPPPPMFSFRPASHIGEVLYGYQSQFKSISIAAGAGNDLKQCPTLQPTKSEK